MSSRIMKLFVVLTFFGLLFVVFRSAQTAAQKAQAAQTAEAPPPKERFQFYGCTLADDITICATCDTKHNIMIYTASSRYRGAGISTVEFCR